MDASIIISGLALGVSAIVFFYKIGQDTEKNESSKIDEVLHRIEKIDKKIDDMTKWQREAVGIHASHSEQIKTLYNKLEQLESRIEDRTVMLDALKNILECVRK